jgi:hypothetical protein
LAHKAEFGKAKQDHEQLETILETVGKTLWRRASPNGAAA